METQTPTQKPIRKPLNLTLPVALIKRLKRRAIDEQTNVSALVEDFARRGLSGNGQPRP